MPYPRMEGWAFIDRRGRLICWKRIVSFVGHPAESVTMTHKSLPICNWGFEWNSSGF